MEMRAAWYAGAGDVDVIQFRTVPIPEPGPGQVRIRVRAAGLNRADLLQRRGVYPAPPGWPPSIPGLEYAGEVEARGTGATRWRVGDRVMGLVGGGAMAECLVVHQDEVLAVPAALTDAEAAAIPEAFLTAWDALVHRARALPGERVLFHAVASGVGTAFLQLARHLAVHPVGTSRSAAKLARIAEYGLSEGIDTSVAPFRAQLAEPVHAVIDTLGGPALADNLHVLHPLGRLVLLGTLLGPRGEADLGVVLRKRLSIVGTVMRPRSLAERIPLLAEFGERVLPLFSAARPGERPALVPVIDHVLPMPELARAQELLERNQTVGKVVVAW